MRVAEADDEEGGETEVDVFGQGEQAWKDILVKCKVSASQCTWCYKVSIEQFINDFS